MDNSRDFTRAMAARLHRQRRWQPNPSVVGGRTYRAGYQPRIRPKRPSGVEFPILG